MYHNIVHSVLPLYDFCLVWTVKSVLNKYIQLLYIQCYHCSSLKFLDSVWSYRGTDNVYTAIQVLIFLQ